MKMESCVEHSALQDIFQQVLSRDPTVVDKNILLQIQEFGQDERVLRLLDKLMVSEGWSTRTDGNPTSMLEGSSSSPEGSDKPGRPGLSPHRKQVLKTLATLSLNFFVALGDFTTLHWVTAVRALTVYGSVVDDSVFWSCFHGAWRSILLSHFLIVHRDRVKPRTQEQRALLGTYMGHTHANCVPLSVLRVMRRKKNLFVKLNDLHWPLYF